MSKRDVLARLLNNQAIGAENDDDPHRALAVYHRITRIAPGGLDAWQNFARLQLAFNDVAGARASLLAMSEVAPDKETRGRIMDAFEALDPTRPVSPSSSLPFGSWSRRNGLAAPPLCFGTPCNS